MASSDSMFTTDFDVLTSKVCPHFSHGGETYHLWPCPPLPGHFYSRSIGKRNGARFLTPDCDSVNKGRSGEETGMAELKYEFL